MSNTFEAYVGGHDFTFNRFRSENPFERFADYAASELSQLFAGPLADHAVVHCLLSGYPIYTIHPTEMFVLIRQMAYALGFDEFDQMVVVHDTDVATAFDRILDRIDLRMLELSKPAPSISYSNNRLSLASLPWTRQMSILLSTLLYDAGMFRDQSMGYETRNERLTATIELAQFIEDSYSRQVTDDLYSALIELDAKYAIRNLTFVRKEAAALEAIRNQVTPDFNRILDFVLKLIAYRDEHSEVVDEGQVWTRDIYAERTFAMIDREKHSNIFKPETPKPVAPKADAPKRGRPAKVPVTPEEIAKAEKKEQGKRIQDNFLSMFDDMFAPAKKDSK